MDRVNPSGFFPHFEGPYQPDAAVRLGGLPRLLELHQLYLQLCGIESHIDTEIFSDLLEICRRFNKVESGHYGKKFSSLRREQTTRDGHLWLATGWFRPISSIQLAVLFDFPQRDSEGATFTKWMPGVFVARGSSLGNTHFDYYRELDKVVPAWLDELISHFEEFSVRGTPVKGVQS